MNIGCVALEVTQRCNLDCTYRYLSESYVIRYRQERVPEDYRSEYIPYD